MNLKLVYVRLVHCHHKGGILSYIIQYHQFYLCEVRIGKLFYCNFFCIVNSKLNLNELEKKNQHSIVVLYNLMNGMEFAEALMKFDIKIIKNDKNIETFCSNITDKFHVT